MGLGIIPHCGNKNAHFPSCCELDEDTDAMPICLYNKYEAAPRREVAEHDKKTTNSEGKCLRSTIGAGGREYLD